MRKTGLLFVAALCSIGWSPKTELAVARRGLLNSPPDLVRQVRKHEAAFAEGIRLAVREEGAEGLRPARSEERIRALAEGIVSKLNTHAPFEEVVRDFGTLAHWAIVAGDPLLGSRDPRLPTYAKDYTGYVDRLFDRLPRVGYALEPDALRGNIGNVIRGARARAEELSPFIGEEYYRSGYLRSSASFDDLAVTYGVASIALGRSAADVAGIFTAVWRRANGLVPPPAPRDPAGWRVLTPPAVRAGVGH